MLVPDSKFPSKKQVLSALRGQKRTSLSLVVRWHRLIACTALLFGNLHACRRHLEAHVQRYPELQSDLAILLCCCGDYNPALVYLPFPDQTQATASFENTAYWRLRALQGLHRWTQARQLIAKVLPVVDSRRLRLAAAQNAIALGDYTGATAHYQQAIKFGAPDATLLHDLARCQQKCGQLSQALENYLAAFRLAPHDPSILSNIGLLLAKLGRFGEATFYLQRLLRYTNDPAGAMNNLAYCLVAQKRFAEALRYYRRALRIAGEDVELLRNTASCLLAMDRPDEARNLLERALRQAPGDHEAWRLRAVCLRESDQRACEQSLNRALSLAPQDPLVLESKAAWLLQQGDAKRAHAFYTLALKLVPDDPILLWGQGTCLEGIGETEAALAAFNRSLAARRSG
ncbi:MAG TPA: tetratricopeptide repeat protein [Firmicutes bacterium]|jgi:tetratricopeptide (TPR) repeat protein|nr:tetratricopeptide repeat protein [Bacillota bacterium]